MKAEWETLDINQLQHLYRESSRKLKEKLLLGASWQDVVDQRRDVIELGIAVHQRLNSSSANPAEHNTRT